MAYVITEPCIDTCNALCTGICPVDCIEKPAANDTQAPSQYFIDPERCVDCGHCAPICPAKAIFVEDDVPPLWQSFIAANAAHFHKKQAPPPIEDPIPPTPPAAEIHKHSHASGPTVSIYNPTDIDHSADLPMWEGEKTALFVSEIIEETVDARTFRFQGRPLCRFLYKAGQFCTLVLNIDGKKVLRSYTISSTPSRPFTLEITVKRVPGGLVSNWLIDSLQVGDPIVIAGPKGKFCLHPGKIPKKILFISAGSGVTPMMAMSRWICDVCADVDIKFFNSARTPDDIIYRKELELLTNNYRAFSPIISTTSRESNKEWMGFRGRVSRELLELAAPDIHERQLYMCGPNPFMDAVKEILREMNFDLANLHTESFGGVRTARSNKSRPAQAVHTSNVAALQHEVQAQTNEQQAGAQLQVVFSRSNKSAGTDGSLPLLDLAEEHDVDIEYSCRSGSCGECRVKLLEGKVKQECDEGLDEAEKAAGYILTCVSTPTTKCILDA